jgi:hypothetical protein
MADQAIINKLEVFQTIKEGVGSGFKNIGSILVNLLLWILTIWIPYLNVGTTIGLLAGIVTKVSRSEPLSPVEIFNPRYRKYIGEFFLTIPLVLGAFLAGLVMVVIPGIVIGIAWSQALFLVVDKDKNPIEALALSNHLTYGNKWRMVGVYFLPGLVFIILAAVFFAIKIIPLVVLVAILAVFASIGIQGSVYRRLTGSV